MGFVSGPEEDLLNEAFFINYKSRAVQPHIISPVEKFFTPDPVFVNDFMLRVGEQDKGKLEFFAEFLVAFPFIGTDTDYREAVTFQERMVVPKVARLYRAGRGVIFRVEKQGEFVSFEIRQ